MKTYRIKRTGDDFTQVIAEGLTKKEAYNQLMELFYRCTGYEYSNWGIAVMKTCSRVDRAIPTLENGTRMFTEDGYIYIAESEEPRGYLYDQNHHLYAREENL